MVFSTALFLLQTLFLTALGYPYIVHTSEKLAQADKRQLQLSHLLASGVANTEMGASMFPKLKDFGPVGIEGVKFGFPTPDPDRCKKRHGGFDCKVKNAVKFVGHLSYFMSVFSSRLDRLFTAMHTGNPMQPLFKQENRLPNPLRAGLGEHIDSHFSNSVLDKAHEVVMRDNRHGDSSQYY